MSSSSPLFDYSSLSSYSGRQPLSRYEEKLEYHVRNIDQLSQEKSSLTQRFSSALSLLSSDPANSVKCDRLLSSFQCHMAAIDDRIRESERIIRETEHEQLMEQAISNSTKPLRSDLDTPKPRKVAPPENGLALLKKAATNKKQNAENKESQKKAPEEAKSNKKAPKPAAVSRPSLPKSPQPVPRSSLDEGSSLRAQLAKEYEEREAELVRVHKAKLRAAVHELESERRSSALQHQRSAGLHEELVKSQHAELTKLHNRLEATGERETLLGQQLQQLTSQHNQLQEQHKQLLALLSRHQEAAAHAEREAEQQKTFLEQLTETHERIINQQQKEKEEEAHKFALRESALHDKIAHTEQQSKEIIDLIQQTHANERERLHKDKQELNERLSEADEALKREKARGHDLLSLLESKEAEFASALSHQQSQHEQAISSERTRSQSEADSLRMKIDAIKREHDKQLNDTKAHFEHLRVQLQTNSHAAATAAEAELRQATLDNENRMHEWSVKFAQQSRMIESEQQRNSGLLKELAEAQQRALTMEGRLNDKKNECADLGVQLSLANEKADRAIDDADQLRRQVHEGSIHSGQLRARVEELERANDTAAHMMAAEKRQLAFELAELMNKHDAQAAAIESLKAERARDAERFDAELANWRVKLDRAKEVSVAYVKLIDRLKIIKEEKNREKAKRQLEHVEELLTSQDERLNALKQEEENSKRIIRQAMQSSFSPSRSSHSQSHAHSHTHSQSRSSHRAPAPTSSSFSRHRPSPIADPFHESRRSANALIDQLAEEDESDELFARSGQPRF